MYAIEEGMKQINGELVDTFLREVVDGDVVMEIEAGSNGYRGGCGRSCESRTYVSLLCLSGDFYFAPIRDEEGNRVGMKIACCGDDGLNTIRKALAFIRKAIDDQCKDLND